MDLSFWKKQSADKPLYPGISWSRPESKSLAGKLAVIGGNAHAFSAVGIAYSEALASGVGVCKVLMPQAVHKTVKHLLSDVEFAPSNPSGGFAKSALDDFISIASWGDGCLLAGDFGRNSETAILLESFVAKYSGLLTLTQDAIDYFKKTPKLVLERPQSMIVVSLAQLQKIFIHTPLITPITYGMSPLQLAQALHSFTETFPVCTVVKLQNILFVAQHGQVVSMENNDELWQVKTAAHASVYWLQNPTSQLKAVVASLQ